MNFVFVSIAVHISMFFSTKTIFVVVVFFVAL